MLWLQYKHNVYCLLLLKEEQVNTKLNDMEKSLQEMEEKLQTAEENVEVLFLITRYIES